MTSMATRKKRSISMPPELDTAVAKAAAARGMTYSAWLAEVARKELILTAGLAAVAQYEREFGAFSAEERAEADAWVRDTLARSKRSGTRIRRSA